MNVFLDEVAAVLLVDGWHQTVAGSFVLANDVRFVNTTGNGLAKKNLVNWFAFVDEADGAYIAAPFSSLLGIRRAASVQDE